MTVEISPETEQIPDIDDLRVEIDRLDAEILAAVEAPHRGVPERSARSGWPPAAPGWCTAAR